MVGLAETLSRLSQSRVAASARHAPVVGDRLSDIDDFGSNPGQLRARIYIPDGLADNAALVVVLHGCTQTAAGYDLSAGWSALADRHGFALLFPEQRQANNPNMCFNWFVPHHVQRGSGEALSIKQMVDTVRARHGVDPNRIFVSGLSAGGAMAGAMLATYPEVFAGGAIIGGLPYGVATSVPSAFKAMAGQIDADEVELMAKVRSASPHQGPWPTLSIWHGTADRTVQAANAAAVLDQWRAVHALPAAPSRTEAVAGFTRRVWTDGNGRDAIEEYLIPGMGHGTPLDSRSGIGRAAPFMLDIGICSSQQLLSFWGLATNEQPVSAPAAVPQLRPAPVEPRIARLEPIPLKAPPPQRPAATGVGKVIEDALRAAGLMK